MSGIWQERVLKKPEDFHAALWAGSCGITENPDFDHPNEVYVGQSLHICNRVRNHLNGKGNGDVYADVREGKPVFVHLERCEEAQMNDLERRLIDAFHATESYNSTRGGAQRR